MAPESSAQRGNEERDTWAASLDGLPVTGHYPPTYEGQIEQAGKIAAR